MTERLKYRIEIEQLYPDSPRPWEWRCYSGDEAEPFLVGSKKTLTLAADEAALTISLNDPVPSLADQVGEGEAQRGCGWPSEQCSCGLIKIIPQGWY